MTTIDVPSGALAFLDLDYLPEETIETLRTSRALTVQFHNPRTYRVYTTPDGFEVRVVGKRARLKRAARHLTIAATVALIGGTILYRVPDYKDEAVVYETTSGERLRVQGDHVVSLDPAEPATKGPDLLEVIAPQHLRLPVTAPSRAALRVSPARSAPRPASTPALPSQAAERATSAVREAPARASVVPAPAPSVKPDPAKVKASPTGVSVEADLPLVGRVGVGLGR